MKNSACAFVVMIMGCFSNHQALAADLGGSAPSHTSEFATHPSTVFWRQFYVRGDIGIAQQDFSGFTQKDIADNGGTFISKSIADSPTIGAGFGWQLTKNLRLDLTGEYRSSAQVKGLDNLTGNLIGPDGALQANTIYQGDHTAFVGLVNGYFDLMNWRGFTPYVGGGIGFAHNRFSNLTTLSSATFTDAATGAIATQLSAGTSQDKSQTNFAWALMAGTSYDLSANAKLDIGYRYISLGDGSAISSNLLVCTCGSVGQPLKINDLHANEFRIGVRWMLDQPADRPYQPLK
jgi:opacity protein-like surface antigen